MTAYEAARMELEIKYCKKLERTLADLRQELENLKREATGEEREKEERKGEKGLLLRVPSYEVVRSEFGEIGVGSGFYRGRDSKLTDKERQRYLMLLRG